MSLNSAEQFLLLAQHPEKGKFIISEVYINYGIIGAILLEMSLKGIIEIENDHLILKAGKSTNSQIIADISSIISKSKKTRKIKHWIAKLSRNSRKYKGILLSALADKKIILIKHKTFLGLIPYKRHYLADIETYNNLIQRIKRDILFPEELTNENMPILGLIEACKMQKTVANDKVELIKIKKALKVALNESPIAASVDKTIKQIQTAVLAAVVASTAATTAVSR